MLKFFSILTITYIICLSAYADSASSPQSNDAFTKQQAFMCIQLNKDLNLASQQMLETESQKAYIKSKVVYLQGAVKERRELIEELDQRSYQQNNENYNQLVNQYEDLVEEKKDTINQFNQKQEMHVVQHNSVIRLEQRFSSKCLNQIVITQELYTEVCELEDVRWCSAFSFN